jgi:hypothetical protein
MRAALLLVCLAGCRSGCDFSCSPSSGGDAAPAPAAGASVAVVNATKTATTAYVSFAADSAVRSFPFCAPDGGNPCSFPLGPSALQALPTGGAYLNITLSFGAPPSCNVTVAEVTVNAAGQDTTDVSLVNGYNAALEVDVVGPDGGKLPRVGPPLGPAGNERVFGVYPLGCDICVARTPPVPCGIPACGSSPNDGGQGCGCKSGGQYDPAVPCQYNPVPKGASYSVVLTDLVPAAH